MNHHVICCFIREDRIVDICGGGGCNLAVLSTGECSYARVMAVKNICNYYFRLSNIGICCQMLIITFRNRSDCIYF